MCFFVLERVCEEDAELFNHLDHLEDEGLVQAVALLEVNLHGGGGDVQGKGASNNKHGLVMMLRSERSQMNCATMTAQMLARSTRRWCMVLMWVLVV